MLDELSLFYPLYNEEANIEEATARALRILPRFARRFEIILVDDGSRDRTGELADQLARRHAEVQVVHHARNRGYGGALRSGLSAARFDWIFYTDGDNQFDLEDLALLVPLVDRFDIVTGYRRDRKDSAQRKLNAWAFNRLVHTLFALPFRDVDCAFKLYRAEFVRDLPLRSEGALIDVEILARARRRGARIGEVGVGHFPRLHGAATGANLRVIARAFRELFALSRDIRG